MPRPLACWSCLAGGSIPPLSPMSTRLSWVHWGSCSHLLIFPPFPMPRPVLCFCPVRLSVGAKHWTSGCWGLADSADCSCDVACFCHIFLLATRRTFRARDWTGLFSAAFSPFFPAFWSFFRTSSKQTAIWVFFFRTFPELCAAIFSGTFLLAVFVGTLPELRVFFDTPPELVVSVVICLSFAEPCFFQLEFLLNVFHQ